MNYTEIQVDGIKEKIRQTIDPAKLRSLEQNLGDYPTLRRQIQERRMEIQNTAPSPIRQIPSTQATESSDL